LVVQLAAADCDGDVDDIAIDNNNKSKQQGSTNRRGVEK